MSHIQKIERIYRGCFSKNRDGTNKLIEKGKICITPTNNPLWKYPEDIPSGVETRSQEKKSKKGYKYVVRQIRCATNTLNKKTFRDG